MKLKTKISGMGITLVFVTAVLIVSITVWKTSNVQREIDKERIATAQSEAAKITRDIYLMCRAAQESILNTVKSSLKVANQLVSTTGDIAFDKSSQPVSWTAINQYNKQQTAIELPPMTVGDTWLGQNSNPQVVTPLVDKVQELVGGTVTVFQRMNDQGDMLRVATNVIKTDGQRAIGTYIPRTNPDGQPNPVISTVLKGETFYGRAFVVNAWYVTAYEPIWNKEHDEVIGILYAGVKQESIESLRHGIMDIVVAKTGYAFILGGKGSQQGKYIISQKGKRDGEVIWEARDSSGNFFVQNIVNKALALKSPVSGEEIPVDFERYQWQPQGHKEPEWKTAAIAYFEPWDWVIGAGYQDSDFFASQKRLDSEIHSMVWQTIIIGIVIIILSLFIGLYVAHDISAPVLRMVDSAHRIAIGDLSQKIGSTSKNEVGQLAQALDQMTDSLSSRTKLAEAIADGDLTHEVVLASDHDSLGRALQKMTQHLSEIIAEINSASQQIDSGSGQVSDSAQDLSQASTEQAAAIEEIGASLTDLSSRTKINASNAEQANQLATQARHAADEGNRQMEQMVIAMEEINVSGQNISKIIKTIDEIAFQTNLLALNAAVEAARAGQHGKGFAVVAEEVRNLAARSAKAAQETADLIEGSVEKGNNGSGIAERTSEALQEIVGGIGKTSDLIAEIAASSKDQAEGLSQISDGLQQVDEIVQRNTAGAEESASAAEELSNQSSYMRQLINQFKLKG